MAGPIIVNFGAAGLFSSENVLTAQDPKNRFGKTPQSLHGSLEANKTMKSIDQRQL